MLGNTPLTQKERSARYREKNKEAIKLRNAGRDFVKYAKMQIDRDREYPEQYLWKTAKRRAKEKHVPFSITKEDIPITWTCPVFGWDLIVRSPGDPVFNSMTLDRIDPTKGYVPGNVQILSYRANELKRNGTLEEFRALLTFLEGHSND